MKNTEKDPTVSLFPDLQFFETEIDCGEGQSELCAETGIVVRNKNKNYFFAIVQASIVINGEPTLETRCMLLNEIIHIENNINGSLENCHNENLVRQIIPLQPNGDFSSLVAVHTAFKK